MKPSMQNITLATSQERKAQEAETEGDSRGRNVVASADKRKNLGCVNDANKNNYRKFKGVVVIFVCSFCVVGNPINRDKKTEQTKAQINAKIWLNL